MAFTDGLVWVGKDGTEVVCILHFSVYEIENGRQLLTARTSVGVELFDLVKSAADGKDHIRQAHSLVTTETLRTCRGSFDITAEEFVDETILATRTGGLITCICIGTSNHPSIPNRPLDGSVQEERAGAQATGQAGPIGSDAGGQP
jgi:hypothetical protein